MIEDIERIEKLFESLQLLSHIWLWVAKTICLAYEHFMEDTRKREMIKAQEVRTIDTSMAYFKKNRFTDIRR